ncbi:MAG: Precorrin-3B methylase [Armatimonadetes bacterium]|nr:Precorrin-3B methylase [Armatimonadota bacterium]
MRMTPDERVKETCRLIREARAFWDDHQNAACRRVRQRAMALYESLSSDEREQVPQVLRVWLRYRSEKYFGAHRTKPKKKRPEGRDN